MRASTFSFPNLETVHCSIFSSNYCFLAYKQISQETGILIFLRIFHSLLWPTQRLYHSQWTRCFFLEFPCFFYDPVDVGNLISGSSAFSNTEHLEVHGSCIAEAWLGEFWALICYHVRWVQLFGCLNIPTNCLSLGLKWKLTFSSPVATAEFSKFAGI